MKRMWKLPLTGPATPPIEFPEFRAPPTPYFNWTLTHDWVLHEVEAAQRGVAYGEGAAASYPSARESSQFCRILPLNDLLLYGGVGLSDTWKYDGTVWTKYPSAGGIVRSEGAMVSISDLLVAVYGGYDATYLGDLSVYYAEDNVWSSVQTIYGSPAAPAPRSLPAMWARTDVMGVWVTCGTGAFGPSCGEVYEFRFSTIDNHDPHGQWEESTHVCSDNCPVRVSCEGVSAFWSDVADSNNNLWFYNAGEVWNIDADAWTWTLASGPASILNFTSGFFNPGNRNTRAVVTGRKVVLFGGLGYDSFGTQGLLGDLWIFDMESANFDHPNLFEGWKFYVVESDAVPMTASVVTPVYDVANELTPGQRRDFGLALTPNDGTGRDHLWVFGGARIGGISGDLWELPLDNTEDVLPTFPDLAPMDGVDDYLSVDWTPHFQAPTQLFDVNYTEGSTWPAARMYHHFCRGILYGGLTHDSQILDDTWFTTQGRTKWSSAGGGSRYGGRMVQIGQWYYAVFGGEGRSGLRNDIQAISQLDRVWKNTTVVIGTPPPPSKFIVAWPKKNLPGMYVSCVDGNCGDIYEFTFENYVVDNPFGSWKNSPKTCTGTCPGQQLLAPHWHDFEGSYNNLWYYIEGTLWKVEIGATWAWTAMTGPAVTTHNMYPPVHPGPRQTTAIVYGRKAFMYGGLGVDSYSVEGRVGDLWIFDMDEADPTADPMTFTGWHWAHLKASDTVPLRANLAGFGGAPSFLVEPDGFFPGQRMGSGLAIDTSGVLWVSGGNWHEGTCSETWSLSLPQETMEWDYPPDPPPATIQDWTDHDWVVHDFSEDQRVGGHAEGPDASYPKARKEPQVATILPTSRILLFGGEDAWDTWVYDTVGGSWTKYPNADVPSRAWPRSRSAMASFYDYKVAMFAGMADGEMDEIINDLRIFHGDSGVMQWTGVVTLGAGTAPRSRASPAMWYRKETPPGLYITAGTRITPDPSMLQEVHEFTLSYMSASVVVGSWAESTHDCSGTCPMSGYDGISSLYWSDYSGSNNHLWLYLTIPAFQESEMWMIDADTWTWTRMTDASTAARNEAPPRNPGARYWAGGISSYSGQLAYLFGGRSIDGDGGFGPMGDVWAYDVSNADPSAPEDFGRSDSSWWTPPVEYDAAGEKTPGVRHSLGAAMVRAAGKDYLWLLCGSASQGAVCDVWSLELGTSTVGPPTFPEMPPAPPLPDNTLDWTTERDWVLHETDVLQRGTEYAEGSNGRYPAARHSPFLGAILPTSDLLMYGGVIDITPVDETWVFRNDGSQWTKYPSAMGDARAQGGMVAVADHTLAVFGGWYRESGQMIKLAGPRVFHGQAENKWVDVYVESGSPPAARKSNLIWPRKYVHGFYTSAGQSISSFPAGDVYSFKFIDHMATPARGRWESLHVCTGTCPSGGSFGFSWTDYFGSYHSLWMLQSSLLKSYVWTVNIDDNWEWSQVSSAMGNTEVFDTPAHPGYRTAGGAVVIGRKAYMFGGHGRGSAGETRGRLGDLWEVNMDLLTVNTQGVDFFKWVKVEDSDMAPLLVQMYPPDYVSVDEMNPGQRSLFGWTVTSPTGLSPKLWIMGGLRFDPSGSGDGATADLWSLTLPAAPDPPPPPLAMEDWTYTHDWVLVETDPVQRGVWYQDGSTPPFPAARSEHVFASIRPTSNFLLYGGYSNSGYSDTWIFRLDGTHWTKYPNAGGLPRVCTRMVSIADHYLAVFSGRDPTTNTDYLDLPVFHAEDDNTWQDATVTSGDPASFRERYAMWPLKSAPGFYVTGGQSMGEGGRSLGLVYEFTFTLYDPPTGSWGSAPHSCLANCPAPGEVHIFWEDYSDAYENLWFMTRGKLFKIQVGAWTWTLVTGPGDRTENVNDPLNPGKRGGSAVVAGRKAYVFGGTGYDAAGTYDRLGDLWEFDMDEANPANPMGFAGWKWLKLEMRDESPIVAGVIPPEYETANQLMPGQRDAMGLALTVRQGLNQLWLSGGSTIYGRTCDLWRLPLDEAAPSPLRDWTLVADWGYTEVDPIQRTLDFPEGTNPPYPAARMNAQFGVVEPTTDFLLYGGSPDLSDTWILRDDGSDWSKYPTAGGAARARGGLLNLVDNYMVVFGGTDGTNFLNDVSVFHAEATNKWREVTAGGSAPAVRAAMTLWRMKTEVGFYVSCGFDSLPCDTVSEFTFTDFAAVPPTGDWGTSHTCSGGSCPDPGLEPFAWVDYEGSYHNLWYLIGGNLWQVAINSWTWTLMTGPADATVTQGTGVHPGIRSQGGVVTVGRKAFIFGGYGKDSNGEFGNLGDLWMFDPAWANSASPGNFEGWSFIMVNPGDDVETAVEYESGGSLSPGQRFGFGIGLVSGMRRGGDDEMVIFGGNRQDPGGSGNAGDTWSIPLPANDPEPPLPVDPHIYVIVTTDGATVTVQFKETGLPQCKFNLRQEPDCLLNRFDGQSIDPTLDVKVTVDDLISCPDTFDFDDSSEFHYTYESPTTHLWYANCTQENGKPFLEIFKLYFRMSKTEDNYLLGYIYDDLQDDNALLDHYVTFEWDSEVPFRHENTPINLLLTRSDTAECTYIEIVSVYLSDGGERSFPLSYVGCPAATDGLTDCFFNYTLNEDDGDEELNLEVYMPYVGDPGQSGEVTSPANPDRIQHNWAIYGMLVVDIYFVPGESCLPPVDDSKKRRKEDGGSPPDLIIPDVPFLAKRKFPMSVLDGRPEGNAQLTRGLVIALIAANAGILLVCGATVALLAVCWCRSRAKRRNKEEEEYVEMEEEEEVEVGDE